MNRIHLLDEAVASRIAAGEVVVNPAAVVKELVENAIDAGADAITVEIEEGGKRLIRVTDNGRGIMAEDVPLAVLKHATSKISMVSDLSNVATMGFRGEALSSMAAVARLAISTRTKEETAGTVLRVNGGGEPQVSAAGLPEGTTVKVENLFYNVPARQKFMKNAAQEASQVGGVVSKMILGHPDIAIKYINNGKLTYQSPGTGLKNALITVYGKDIADKILAVSHQSGAIAIEGYISRPSLLYKTGSHLVFYLNSRYIQSNLIKDALLRGYGERLLRSHFPFAALNIKMPYNRADVNVHPGKLNVLFNDERGIEEAVYRAIEEALQQNAAPRIIPKATTESTAPIRQESPHQIEIDQYPRLNSAVRLYRSSYGSLHNSSENLMDLIDFKDDNRFEQVMDDIIAETEDMPVQGEIEDVRKLVDYNVIGQAFQTYLLCECDDTLYLIDQHAAHERINFERMKREITDSGIASQQLLMPVAKKFSQQDFDMLKENESLLAEIGFDLEEFGALTFKFSAFPVQVEKAGTDSLIEEVLYELKNRSGEVMLVRDRVIRAACRHSIKAGDMLSDEEIAWLIGEITNMEAIPTCPHGRPIAVALTKDELQKGFKRTI